MGSTGIVVRSRTTVNGSGIQREPIKGTISQWENPLRRREVEPNIEHGALYDENGKPIIGYKGERHSVAVDRRVLDTPNATFTHYHPDKSFGGTLSMQDLKVFSRSNLRELRAVSGQGQLYSIRANGNVDREGLRKWINSNQKMAQKNFNQAYSRALKEATTPLKSGPHKGEVKLTTRRTVRGEDGQRREVRTVTYRKPMTQQQAINYARATSVGMFDRMYGKALSRYGVTYTSTKAGRNYGRR